MEKFKEKVFKMEWFAGVVGAIIAAVVGGLILNWLWERWKEKSKKIPEKEPSQFSREGDDIKINAGGDVLIAKDNGRVIQFKNSQIGVVGDNAEIKGGIQFKDKK